MSEDYKILIPQGYYLKHNKKRGCPLCQRPEFRGEVDTMVWSRKYDPMELANLIKKSYDLLYSPREIQGHSYHFDLYKTDKKLQEQTDNEEIDDFIKKEEYFLNLSRKRTDLTYDENAELLNNLKALSAELMDLKLQGYENDDKYLRKMELFRKMLELRYKQKGDISEQINISLPVQEIDELFKEFEKRKRQNNESKE